MSLKVVGSAQVYKVQDKGNFVIASLRTSQKNKQTDEWESEFFNAKFVGKCKEQAASLADKDKVTIIESKLENKLYKEKYYTSVVVFEFTSEASTNNAPVNTQVERCETCGATDGCDCELPF